MENNTVIIGGEALRGSIARGEFRDNHLFNWSDSEFLDLAKLAGEACSISYKPEFGELAKRDDLFIPFFIWNCQTPISGVAQVLSLTAATSSATPKKDLGTLGKMEAYLGKLIKAAENLGPWGVDILGEAISQPPQELAAIYEKFSSGEIDLVGLMKIHAARFDSSEEGLFKRYYAFSSFVSDLMKKYEAVLAAIPTSANAASSLIGEKGKRQSYLKHFLAVHLGGAYRKVLGDTIVGEEAQPFTDILDMVFRAVGWNHTCHRDRVKEVSEALKEHRACLDSDACLSTSENPAQTLCPFGFLYGLKLNRM